MLVLSRKRNESLFIGEIEVVVVDIRGDKVRLGVVAPADVPVHRREVKEAIERQGKVAGPLSKQAPPSTETIMFVTGMQLPWEEPL